jgi:uncharacterized membrane protein
LKTESQSNLSRFVHPVALWVSVLLLVGALRDQYSLVGAFDTGLYLQWLYGFWRQGSLASSVTGEANFLAHHFQPVALLFAPLVGAFGRPVILYLVAAAALAAAWWIGRQLFCGSNYRRSRWYNGVFVVFAAHPALAGRVWYGFVPDLLALPAFFWMALTLADPQRKAPVGWRSLALWLSAFAWAGMAKETFWLTNGFVAVAAMLLRRESRAFFAICAGLQFAVFAFLFLRWMPAHTNMPSYYGLRFYLDVAPGAAVTIADFAGACLRNLFSLRTPVTLGWLLLLTCALPLLRWSWLWVAAIPGLMIILLAKEGQVHHPANHYLIPVLPFIMAPVFYAQERYGQLWAKIGRGVGPALLALIPAGFCFFMTGGIIEQMLTISQESRRVYLRHDVQQIKVETETSTPMIVDGLLQPLFYDYPDVTVLLGHVGNPVRRPVLGNTETLTIVTSVDLKAVPDCSRVLLGGTHLIPDYAYFQDLCARVQTAATTVRSFPDSGLVVYRLPP